MLVPKKIEKKKLIIYIIIIGVMLSGTGFFIYKNYSITTRKKAPLISNPPDLKSAEQLDLGASEEVGVGVEIEESDQILDIDILSDPKFRALKDNTVEKTSEIPAGKENPFEPY
jgi:hypothetical protein